jgi:Mn2+/Fe2+ NRAMP family transporter
MVPQVAGELAGGLIPRMPSREGELLMLVSLIGIVMSGSATVYYSAWVEEREMGLFAHARGMGRRLAGKEIEPQSDEEVRRMHGWLRVNRINVSLAYVLGALICFSTFVLGVAVLGPEGAKLKGVDLARELSLMMTKVLGPWAKGLFYAGTWAAVASTIVAIFDGSSRVFVQPLRQHLPAVYAKLSFGAWQKILMTLMMFGSFAVYALKPDALTLVIWMGAVDAPLVGILILAYAYLARRYIPKAYRSGVIWAAAMLLIGIVYLAFGAYYGYEKVIGVIDAGT